MSRYGWVFFISSLFLVACAKPKLTPLKSLNETKYTDEAKRHFNTFGPKAVAPPLLDVKSYHLQAAFDWPTLTLKATLQITLQLLDVKNDAITLSSRVTRLDSVTAPDGTALSFTTSDGKLTIALPAELANAARRGSIQIALKYETKANSATDAALAATPVRKGDPVKRRTVATLSEPLGAEEWMPCHNSPADRALFSTRFTTVENEKFISNGELKEETVHGGFRHTTYATSYTLPTYLMAFAFGNFEVVTDTSFRVPLQIWHRKGLSVDTKGMLSFLKKTMEHFESLLVNYPFEKYALVLLPAFNGGLEHASITFQGETRSSHSRVVHDLELTAHEMAHQWFGDLMTISSWDDLWIKEGMATLLAQEAIRFKQDATKSGRRFARDFTVEEGHAIRDLSLAPNDKYTSGPYGRAAWAYTQLRSLWGEARFWGWLATLLKTHAFASLGTDDLLAAVENEGGKALANKFKLALAAKALPTVASAEFKDQRLTLTLVDQENSLIAPIEIHTLALNEMKTRRDLAVGKNVLPLPEKSVLVLDPQDAHPLFEFGFETAAIGSVVNPLLVGNQETNAALFPKLGAANQIDALQFSHGWQFTPDNFLALYNQTHSDTGRYSLIGLACGLAVGQTPAWKTALLEALKNPPGFGVPDPALTTGWSACRPLLGATFDSAWDELLKAPERSGEVEPELLQLALVSRDQAAVFATVKKLTALGGTVRTQRMMLELLALHLASKGSYEPPAVAEEWKQWLRNFISVSEVEESLTVAISILTKAKDVKSLAVFAAAINETARVEVRHKLFCGAHSIAAEQTAEWLAFTKQIHRPMDLITERCSK